MVIGLNSSMFFISSSWSCVVLISIDSNGLPLLMITRFCDQVYLCLSVTTFCDQVFLCLLCHVAKPFRYLPLSFLCLFPIKFSSCYCLQVCFWSKNCPNNSECLSNFSNQFTNFLENSYVHTKDIKSTQRV